MAFGAEFFKKHSEHRIKKLTSIHQNHKYSIGIAERQVRISILPEPLLFCTYKIKSTFVHKKVFIENISLYSNFTGTHTRYHWS